MGDIPGALHRAAGCDITGTAAGAASILFGDEPRREAPVDVEVTVAVTPGGTHIRLIGLNNCIAGYTNGVGKPTDKRVVL